VTNQNFDTFNDWVHATAALIATILTEDIAARGATTLAVSGGRTACAILPTLAKANVDWSRVTITLTDERWVDPTHTDSNQRLANELLAPIMNRATFVGLYTGAPTPEDGLIATSTRIETLLPLGCVLLGMGEDGHIASLFPGTAPRQETLQTAIHGASARISMSPRTLLNAHAIVVAANGPEKCTVLKRALHDGPTSDFPICHVLHQDQTPVYLLTC